MALYQLNPFIRYAKKHVFYKHHKEYSLCYDCRIFFIAQGEGSLTIQNTSFPLSKGAIVYLPPKTKYKFLFNLKTSLSIYVVNFDLTDQLSATYSAPLGTALESTFNHDLIPDYVLPAEFQQAIIKQDCNHLLEKIAICSKLFLEKGEFYREIASANLKLLLLDLIKQEKTDKNLCQNVVEYLHKHYADWDLNNQKIAEQFHYHPYHINRIIKQSIGKTLHNYLIDYRLNMAKNLLVSTSDSISQVAEKSGFSSYNYFIKIFRERIGRSPKAYRKEKTFI